MNALILCFVDIETDGPVPGDNSMLSLACVAKSEEGEEIGVFSRNLCPLEEAEPEPSTFAWWQTQPEAWAVITSGAAQADRVISDFVAWVRDLPSEAVFAAHPLIFDGLWVDWYLRRFAQTRLFRGPHPGAVLFVGAGIDIPSYVQAAMGMSYFHKRPDYPPEILDGVPHSHKPVDDARGHAALYFNARRIAQGRRKDGA
jgi:hypothetical protein